MIQDRDNTETSVGGSCVITGHRRIRSIPHEITTIPGTDLDAPVPRPRPGRPAPSVRWALTHVIEESGRHAGHAGILRELIDGTTGR
ncbi:DUF664 domain-containing protein [Sphaerimonospora mesophila]|uniref:mycothiol transferase n=1 Tax=Sphaerimonospora mesophila TaxID=37483 RepID=UPI000A651C72